MECSRDTFDPPIVISGFFHHEEDQDDDAAGQLLSLEELDEDLLSQSQEKTFKFVDLVSKLPFGHMQ